MTLQTVIKLCLTLEKNIPPRSNYRFCRSETFKLEIKIAKTRHIFRNSVINAKLMKPEMLKTRQYSILRFP